MVFGFETRAVGAVWFDGDDATERIGMVGDLAGPSADPAVGQCLGRLSCGFFPIVIEGGAAAEEESGS